MNRLAGLQRNGLIDANRILNTREKSFFNHIFKKDVFTLKPGAKSPSQKVLAAPKIFSKF